VICGTIVAKIFEGPPLNTLAGWFWLIALSATAIWYVIVIGRLLFVAIRTGRLQSRGVVYDRSSQPIRYWFLSIGFTAIGIILIVAALIYANHFLSM